MSRPPASSGQMKGAVHRHVGGYQGGPEPAEGGREQQEEADRVTWERGPSESTHFQTVARGQGSRWAPRAVTLRRATPPLTLNPLLSQLSFPFCSVSAAYRAEAVSVFFKKCVPGPRPVMLLLPALTPGKTLTRLFLFNNRYKPTASSKAHLPPVISGKFISRSKKRKCALRLVG